MSSMDGNRRMKIMTKVSKIVDKYQHERDKLNNSRKWRKRNMKIIEKSDLVEKFSLRNNKNEMHAFNMNDSFNCTLSLTQEIKNLKLKFRQDSGKLFFGLEVKNTFPLRLFGKEEGRKYKFKTDSLYLNPSPYEVILENSERVILDDIKINVLRKHENEDGKYSRHLEKKLPSKAIFVERNNSESYFPRGDFISISSKNNKKPELPLPVITERSFLEKIESGYLFRDGKFSKEVDGEEKWCLLPSEDR